MTMHDYLFIIPICLFLLIGVMSPGPSFLLVAQTAMSKSRKDALAVVFGLGIGASIFSIVACVGLFIVLDNVKWLYFVLKCLGAAYLVYLAIKIWRNADAPITSELSPSKSGLVRMFVLGLFTQLSNPKTAIVFASAFATFLPHSTPDYSFVLVTLAAFLIDTIWYTIVAFGLSTQKAQATFSRFKKHICRCSSSLMAFMGVKLLANS